MIAEETLASMLVSIGELEVGKEFVIKDLFKGTTWNDFTRGERLSIGKMFKNRVDNRQVPGVVYGGKRQNNSAWYRREG